MIAVNWLAIVVCGVLGMVIGTIWHSQILFGKAYMEAAGMDMNKSPEEMKRIQKGMWKVYLAQFILLLIELCVLSHVIVMGNAYFGSSGVSGGLQAGFWVWLGFVMPTVAGACMWSPRPKKMAWKLFFISAGYQLVSLLIFGAILATWTVTY